MKRHYPFWIFDKYSVIYNSTWELYKEDIKKLSYNEMMNGVRILEKYYINKLKNVELEMFILTKEEYYFFLEKFSDSSNYFFVCSRVSDKKTESIFKLNENANYEEHSTINFILSKRNYYFSSDIFEKVQDEDVIGGSYTYCMERSKLFPFLKEFESEIKYILHMFYYYLPEIIFQIKSLNFNIDNDIKSMK